MKRYYMIVLTVAVLVIATGIGSVLAGGSSDSSGEGSHCYLFFTLPDGKFTQAMVNDSDPDEVIKKAEELIEKYVGDEGGTLDLSVGNIEDTLCGTDDDSGPPIITWYGIDLESMILGIELDYSQVPHDEVCVSLDGNELQVSEEDDGILMFELLQEPPRDTWVSICAGRSCGQGQSECERLVIPSKSEDGYPILFLEGSFMEITSNHPVYGPTANRAKKNGRATVRPYDL